MKAFYTTVSALAVGFIVSTVIVDANPLPAAVAADFGTIARSKDTAYSIVLRIDELKSQVYKLSDTGDSKFANNIKKLKSQLDSARNTANAIATALGAKANTYASKENRSSGRWNR